MVGHAIVEIGVVAAIVLGVQALTLTTPAISLILGFGGIVIVLFGLLALREYRIDEPSKDGGGLPETSATTVLEATAQGAAVSLLSPYFLLWWFAVGLSSVTMLVAELQVGVGTVLLAGILIYLTHVSTDFLFGAVLTMSTDKASEKTKAVGFNWISMVIGLFQVILGAWFLLQALQIWLGTA
jgi:threonine/homoserine/homoserine lactone efflux protein